METKKEKEISESAERIEEEGEEEESEEEKEATERAPPNPNVIDLDAVKELEKIYGKKLREEWNIAKEKSLKNPKKAEEIISKMGNEWIELSEIYFPIAYSIGQDCACQILESSPQVTIKEASKSLEERISWNKKFVKTSLEKALIEKSTKLVEKVEYDDMGEVFDSLESRIDHYEHAVYSVAGNGMQNEFNVSEEQVLYYWKNTSGHPCSDCADLAVGSPYVFLDQLPGDGATKCGGWCYCQIIIHRTGEPKLPPNITEPPDRMIPKKVLSVTSTKISKSSREAKSSTMSYQQFDKTLKRVCSPKDAADVELLFYEPRFKSLMMKEGFFKKINHIKIDAKLRYAGEWNPIAKIITLNPYHSNTATLTHEIAHCITGQTKYGFSKMATFGRAATSRIEKAYVKAVSRYTKALKKRIEPRFKEIAEYYTQEISTKGKIGRGYFYESIHRWEEIQAYELRNSGVYRTYGLKNPSEYMSTGFEAYITDPTTLRKKDKILFDIVEEFFQKGTLKE